MQSARRRLAYLRVSLGFFAIIALTGCRVDSVVTLDIGQTGSGVLTVSMTADKDVVDQTPSLISSFRFEDAIAAQFTSLFFKFLLVLWIVGMAITILTISYKRRSELRTPTE